MQRCPEWCARHPLCWSGIVDRWLSPEWAEKSAIRRDCRLQMTGTPHHQGNQSLSQYASSWVIFFVFSSLWFYYNSQFSLLLIIFMFSSQSGSHQGQECNDFMAFSLAHKGKATDPGNTYNPAHPPEEYTNPSAHSKVTEYTSAARRQHGDDFDPATEPLDAEIVMRLGGGKQHGRYWMANSALDSASVPNLADLRARSTSSSLPIRPRQLSSQQQISDLAVSTRLFFLHIYLAFALFNPCGWPVSRPTCGGWRRRRRRRRRPSGWRGRLYKPRGRPRSRGYRTCSASWPALVQFQVWSFPSHFYAHLCLWLLLLHSLLFSGHRLVCLVVSSFSLCEFPACTH